MCSSDLFPSHDRPAGLADTEVWRVQIYESQLFSVYNELCLNSGKGYKVENNFITWMNDTYQSNCLSFDRTCGFFNARFETIRIYPLSTIDVQPIYVVLRDAWIKERDDVKLDYSDVSPWKWNISIRYSVLEEPHSLIADSMSKSFLSVKTGSGLTGK